MKPFNLALIQMNVIGGAREKNLARTDQLITEAVRHGAEFVLLFGFVDLGWRPVEPGSGHHDSGWTGMPTFDGSGEGA